MKKKQQAYLIYLCAFVNLLASFAMLFLLRKGTPIGGKPSQRLAFIHSSTVIWILGWCIWMAAAVFLLLFFAILRENLKEDLGEEKRSWNWVLTLAIMLASGGIACDIASETLSSTALVTLAHQFAAASDAGQATLLNLYAILDRISVALTGFLGNGLYSIAGILLNFAAFQVERIPRWLCWQGISAWLAGFALSLATLANSEMGMMVATAILMPLFILWAVLMGHFYVYAKEPQNGN